MQTVTWSNDKAISCVISGIHHLLTQKGAVCDPYLFESITLLLLEKEVLNSVLREDYQFMVLTAYSVFKTNIKTKNSCWVISNLCL